MNIKVNINNLEIINQDKLNSGEYNIHECEFDFDEVYNGLIKRAVFSVKEHSYQIDIINNKCQIPYEVLKENGNIEIGVYAFEINQEELKLRYSPKPITKYINTGSYKEHYDNYEKITPTDKEQIEQMLENFNVTAEKENKTTTLIITNKDGQTNTVTIEDGVGLEYNWNGTSLGIKRDDEQTYEYVNLKGDTGAAGAIKMLIVNALPTTGEEGTLYFVPKTTSQTQDIYDEYMWVNNSWELLGEKQITVDLSNYYTKQEVNALIPTNVSAFSNDVGYLTQHQDISGKEDTSNKVTSISSNSTDTQYPSAKCVYDLVGDVETILTTLTTGGGVN